MQTAEAKAVLKSYAQSSLVSDIYDNDDEFAEALNTLIPGFEYPNHSHQSIATILARDWHKA